MQTKSLVYSYPTSQNAKELGFYCSGCWSVDIVTYSEDKTKWTSETVQSSEEKLEAVCKFESLDLPIDNWSHNVD